MAFSHSTSHAAFLPLFCLLCAAHAVADEAAPTPPGVSVSASSGATKPLVAPSKKKDADIDATPVMSRLTAETIRYEGDGGIIVAEGSATKPAHFLSGAGEITAQTVRVDTVNRTVKADGMVVLKRTRHDKRKVIRSDRLPARYESALITETLRGANLNYDFKTKQGNLDQASVQLADFNLDVKELLINGDKYIAHNVILRPGGQTPEEDKIYGVPPLNLRAKTLELTVPEKGGPVSLNGKGAGLYFKNTRLLPLPRYLFRFSQNLNAPREKEAFSITPALRVGGADRILLTTRMRYPLSAKANSLALVADLGASARLGFRGGAGMELSNGLGQFAVGAKVKDIITTQLTNKIQLDRLPELSYRSPDVRLFKIPGGRQTGFRVEASIGNYHEKLISTPGNATVRSSRRMAGIYYSTRLPDAHGITPSGPYVDLFATAAHYSLNDARYNTTGYEVGYDGHLTRRIRGVLSYRHTNVGGDTPFFFDELEIPREVRATFDYQLSPRYLIPVDLRYDLDQKKLRDESIGLLRSYKNFAYGITYDSARRDISLEFRTGF
jgi:hypothetical protein